MSMYDYDLFIIGAGSGGLRAARLAGSLGKRVAIAEEYRIGGTCIIRGCIPKKILNYSASYSRFFKESPNFGWIFEKPIFNWKKLISSKNKEIKRLENTYYQFLKKNNVTVYMEKASFFDNHTIYFENTKKRVTSEKILIATGGRPEIPNFSGNKFCISSNEIFDLESIPDSIVIIGGGYIAVEFANIFHELGVKVTLSCRGNIILKSFDTDLRESLEKSMMERGIKIIYNSFIKKVDKEKSYFLVKLSNDRIIKTEKVMLACGRIPNTYNLHLKNAGILSNSIGAIHVNSFMQTNILNVWAIGDVINRIQLTPVAIHEAQCFIENAFEDKLSSPNYNSIATAIFSYPEIGTVGFSEEEAIKKFPFVKVYRKIFLPMKNSISSSEEKMLIKLIVDGESNKILGAHIFGENASEIIQLLAIPIIGNVTKDIFDSTVSVHPTLSEEIVTIHNPIYHYHHGKKILIN